MKNIFHVIIAAVIGHSLPASAWGHFGHMMVAYSTYQNLTPQSKARVTDLLQLNPKVGEWAAWVPTGTSSDASNRMVFMFAATWADEIKGDPNYTSDGDHDGNRPDNSPDPTANKRYDDKLMHKYWHFVDKPFSQDGTTLPPIPTPNVQERIGLFRGVLASTTETDALKSYDLTWLLHLVGDVHQPLHCATRVSSTDTAGDDGGNLVKLSGTPPKLHKFWDDTLGTGNPQDIVAAVIKAAKKLPSPDPALASDSSENDWVSESFQASQNSVYVSPILAGDGPFTTTSTYKKKAKALAAKRVALAGVRLANLINNELK